MRALVVPIVIAAAADDASAAPKEETAAIVHLDRGIAAFEAGDFTNAKRELALAHELAPERPNPYRWLALTDVQLGDCASALEHIDGFVSRVPPDDARLPEMVRLRDLCGRTGTLVVDSRPSAATLRIDGSIVGRTPYRSSSMRAGEHTVVAELPERVSASRTVTLRPEGQLDLMLDLPSAQRPVTHRWWFWTTIGVIAAGTAGAIVYATSGSSITALPPIRCDMVGCHP